MMQRPQNFVLDYSHSLARGLVFAGLAGGCIGSKNYVDSSPRRNHGVLTNMTPSTDWCWVPELGRWGLEMLSPPEGVSIPADVFGGLAAFSVSFWNKAAYADAGIIQSWVTTASNQQLLVRSVQMSGTLQFYTKTTTGSVGGVISTISTNSLYSDNEFDSYTLCYDGAKMSCYRNGVKSATEFSQSGTIQTTTNGFRIGKVGSYTSEFNNTGLVVDPFIHSRALTLHEIQTLANPADPSLGGLIQPPKRRYYGIPYIRPGFRYKLGRLLLQRT